jgi:ankyrin repeat protein
MSGKSIALRKITNRSSVPNFNSDESYNYQQGGSNNNNTFLELVKSGSYDLATNSLNSVNNIMIKDSQTGNNVLHYIAQQSGGYIKNASQKLLDSLNSNLASLSNTKNYEGNTPLHIAAINDNNELIHYLKEHGANLSIQNGSGKQIRLANNNTVSGGNLETLTENEFKKLQDVFNRDTEDIKKRASDAFSRLSSSASDVYKQLSDRPEFKQGKHQALAYGQKLSDLAESTRHRQDVQQLENEFKKLKDRVNTEFLTEDRKKELNNTYNTLKQKFSELQRQVSTQGQSLPDNFTANVSDLRKNIENKLQNVTQGVKSTTKDINSKLSEIERQLESLKSDIKSNPGLQNILQNAHNSLRLAQEQLQKSLSTLSPPARDFQQQFSQQNVQKNFQQISDNLSKLSKQLSDEASKKLKGGSNRLSETSSDVFLKKLNDVLDFEAPKKQSGGSSGKTVNGSRRFYFTLDSANEHNSSSHLIDSEQERPFDPEAEELHKNTTSKLKKMGLSDEQVRVMKAVLWKRAKEANQGKTNVEKSQSMYDMTTEDLVDEIKGSSEYNTTRDIVEQRKKEREEREARGDQPMQGKKSKKEKPNKKSAETVDTVEPKKKKEKKEKKEKKSKK